MAGIPSFTSTLEFRLLILAVAAVGCAAVIILVSRRLVNHSSLPPRVRSALLLLVTGPVSAVIIGLALIEMLRLSAGAIPHPLTQAELDLIVELVVLSVVVRTAGAMTKHLMIHLTGKEGLEREIVYGIYGLGLVAVAYALLAFPGSPLVIAGVWQAVGFIAGLTITYLVSYIVSAATKRYGEALYTRDPPLRTTVVFVRRLIIALVVLAGVGVTTFAMFPTAGAAVASIFVAAGFASIVVGLAAQSSLANIFAGLIVSTARPFRIGDAVLFQMPWGAEWCWIEDIKLTFTVMKTWDKRRLVIPNQTFLSQALVNYDLTDSSKLCIVYVTIAYEADVDRAIQILKDVAKAHPSFLPDGNLPVVHLMDMGDANGTIAHPDAAPGVTLRLLSNAKDQPTNFQMSKDILYSVRKEFLKNGIKFAYPRREIFLREEKEGEAPGTGGSA